MLYQDWFKEFQGLVRQLYPTHSSIPLHEPCFKGNETTNKNYIKNKREHFGIKQIVRKPSETILM